MTPPQPADTLFDKLRRLPPERVAEVEDFVDFLASRDQDRGLVRDSQAITSPTLQSRWDNAHDAAYDRL